MLAQKLAVLSPSSGYFSASAAAADTPADTRYGGGGDEVKSKAPQTPLPGSPQSQRATDSEGEDGRTSSQSCDEKDEYVLVKLEDVSKEVECPLCFEIIRKTRAFMECLHRFCKECIDKAMRLGKKECPVCRTRCATRRSLRDDPNFDALIAALFPDIDKHEEIQASMAETFLKRSGALGQRRSTPKVTAAARMKRSQGGYQPRKNNYYRRRSRAAARNVSPILSDYDEDEDVEGNDAIKRSSSSEELCTDRIHKRRRMIVPGSSTARLDLGSENYVTEMIRTSPLPAGSKELAWGKGGVRSQTRHGSANGPNGRFARAQKLTRLIEYLHNLDENEDKFIAIETSEQVEGIDVFVRNPRSLTFLPSKQVEKVSFDASEEMQILGAEESLAGLLTSFASSLGDLLDSILLYLKRIYFGFFQELMYRINVREDR
ncbi:hypothetical protein IEQ34_011758 [Dendrobium chrysotoxum]|uniref:RING-type domain-containing protein n=1 Tax=Dendrobium chrysotoxum TaxID=161865 RepID=A0AAV7GTR6_DENCH|nr:hypothetical protein IEQ34_011758 [Dendrobium chrysotoxum]